jgi:TonB family protein
MKSITIGKDGKEFVRVAPNKISLLVGRSPACDVVLRAKGVQPIQFLLECVGEGGLDDPSSFWTVIDISQNLSHLKKEEGSGEGVVIGSDRVQFKKFEFQIVVDNLQETDLQKGLLKREIKKQKGDPKTEKGSSVLELVSLNKELDSVVNVQHFDRKKSPKVLKVFPRAPELDFVWSADDGSLGELRKSGSSAPLELFNRGERITADFDRKNAVQLESSDFIQIETPKIDYYLRSVPSIDVEHTWGAWRQDYLIRILILTGLLVGLLYYCMPKAPEVAIDALKDTPRIATVMIKEAAPPTPPTPPTPEPEAAPAPPAPVVEAEPEKHQSDPQAEDKKAEVYEAAPAQPIPAPGPLPLPKSTSVAKPKPSKSRPVVSDVNNVGLLGKLKGVHHNTEKVTANMMLNERSNAEEISSGVVVSNGPMAKVTVGKTVGTENQEELKKASTTLSDADVADPKSSPRLVTTRSKTQFSTDSKIEGTSVNERVNAAVDRGSIEVAGGLSKEAVRSALAENRLAIKDCYESSLLTHGKLEGRMTFRWVISPEGPVSTVRLQSSSFNIPQFDSCVEAVVKATVFPKAPNMQPTTVTYPFIFQGVK